MKILIDMNLSPEWASFLEGSGFEAVHWSVVGSPSAPDAVIFAHAVAADCVIMTLDLDFSAILARPGSFWRR